MRAIYVLPLGLAENERKYIVSRTLALATRLTVAVQSAHDSPEQMARGASPADESMAIRLVRTAPPLSISLHGYEGMAEAQYHVSLNSLSHVFTDGRAPLPALQDISLGVPRGQFLSIIGPTGSGKSTLLRIAGGLLSPSQGGALIDGEAPAKAQRQHEIGIVFQDSALLPWRNVLANVRLPQEIAGSGRRSLPDPEELIDLVGLNGFRDYYPHQLSGGMQQRVAIARALAFDPSLLLMDEPFGALDEITRSDMRYELLRLWSRVGSAGRKTVLFVTHSIAEALVLSDRVVVLSSRPGRMLADLEIELDRPRTQEVERSPTFLDYSDYLRGMLREAA
jgi:NitT/TauT family transport system ATP-binding protein